MKSVKTRDLVNDLKYDWVVGEDFCQTNIKIYGLNRGGLELIGFAPEQYDPKYYHNSKDRRLVLLSHKESLFLSTLNPQEEQKCLERLTSSGIPLIVLADQFENPQLIKMAKKNHQPIACGHDRKSAEMMVEILQYLSILTFKQGEVHGALANIFGEGVLVKGESGIGKSELMLALLKRNHLFIGDDRIVIYRRLGKIIGHSHRILKNLLEIRGLGIIDLEQMFGLQYTKDSTEISLVIELTNEDLFKAQYERINMGRTTENLLGCEVNKVVIPVATGRNIADLIEAAVIKLKYERVGKSGLGVIKKRIDQEMGLDKDSK